MSSEVRSFLEDIASDVANLTGESEESGSDVYKIVTDYGADPSAAGDSTTAIQAAIDDADGLVFFPAGNYTVTSTITVPNGITLVGAGVHVTLVSGQSADFTVFDFEADGGMRDLFVAGYTNASATTYAVDTAVNAKIFFRDCYIWGGLYAVRMRGVDGCLDNCFISGWATAGGHLYSTGAAANWYIRCKFDDSGSAVNFGVGMDGATGTVENHFDLCDFSGSFVSASLAIDDGDKSHAITGFSHCVFSSPVILTNAKATMFSVCEFGDDITVSNDSVTNIVGCYSFSAQTPAGANTAMAANFNIS
jgi:hypothetical protein